MDRIRLFLLSTRVPEVFDYLNLGVEDIQINKLFIQESSDPYTCYNGRFDADETDVDCGGSCLARCSSKQKCSEDADCAGTMSCFSGKCVGLSRSGERISSRLDSDFLYCGNYSSCCRGRCISDCDCYHY